MLTKCRLNAWVNWQRRQQPRRWRSRTPKSRTPKPASSHARLPAPPEVQRAHTILSPAERGPGVGNGRQIAGMVLENFLRRWKKGYWYEGITCDHVKTGVLFHVWRHRHSNSLSHPHPNSYGVMTSFLGQIVKNPSILVSSCKFDVSTNVVTNTDVEIYSVFFFCGFGTKMYVWNR